jgi:hypothetical protein
MQAIRQIVKRESIKAVFVPEEFGDNVEILVLPLKEVHSSKGDSAQFMQLQEQSGFVKTVLADSKEDVWNDF